MNIDTVCDDRKAMAKGLAEFLGCDCEYLRTPTYAFRVGNLQVERDASITGEADDLRAAAEWLIEHSYWSRMPVELAGTTATDFKAPAEDNYPDGINICIPVGTLTPQAMVNTLRMLYARQNLITLMTQCDFIAIDEELMSLLDDAKPNTVEQIHELLDGEITAGMVKGVSIEEGQLRLSTRFPREDIVYANSYAQLLNAIVTKAAQAHHVSGKRVELCEDEAKYFCRGFLLQLGFGGAQHKDLRAALLNHLPGFAAFRTIAKMNEHKQKYTELRRQYREMETDTHREVHEHEEG